VANTSKISKRGFQECFATLKWNCELFSNGLKLADHYYFDEAYRQEYRVLVSEEEQRVITQDNGRFN